MDIKERIKKIKEAQSIKGKDESALGVITFEEAMDRLKKIREEIKKKYGVKDDRR